MSVNHSVWSAVCVSVLAASLGGCATGHQDAPEAPPPPPKVEAKKTYDYPHAVHQRPQTLRRKLVLGLVRFADDGPVADAPYGPATAPAEAGPPLVEVSIGTNVAPARKEDPGLSPRHREVLKRELLDTGMFVIVERDRILDILREIQFGETRYVNPDTNPEIGEVMSVQYLVEGSIGLNEDRSYKDTFEAPPRYDERGPTLAERVLRSGRDGLRLRSEELREMRLRHAARVEMRASYPYGVYLSLYNVRTSEVAAEAYGIGGTPLEAVRDAAEELADRCRAIPQPPRVAWVDGGRVFVDLGETDGIKVGQRLRYVGQGAPIRNAAGQVIGYDEHDGGVVEVTRVDALMSVGRVIEKGADPAVGDRVELVK
jgi:hypothetical protein